MTTLIIEDEPLVAKDLQKLIHQIDPSIQILATLDSVKSSVEYFNTHAHPDFVFMDIQLSDGVSFDLFTQIQIECPIIFTTAYDEYAIRAFKVNSIGYLLKPIDREELVSTIEKFRNLRPQNDSTIRSQLEMLIHQFGQSVASKIYKERFLVNFGKSNIVLNQANVSHFQKDALIYLVTSDNKRFVTDFKTMDEIDELIDPKVFFRANRQLIIHRASINNFRSDMYGKLIVTLKPPMNLTIDISREKASAFKNWIE